MRRRALVHAQWFLIHFKFIILRKTVSFKVTNTALFSNRIRNKHFKTEVNILQTVTAYLLSLT
jgi:hypothetical protein